MAQPSKGAVPLTKTAIEARQDATWWAIVIKTLLSQYA